MIIKEMADIEKPREKALRYGIETLSNTELLALVIRCGTKSQSALELAQTILNKCDGLSNIHKLGLNELKEIKGIKDAKALELIGCIELSKRVMSPTAQKVITIKSAIDVYNYLHAKMVLEKQEKFYVMFLDSKNKVIKEKAIFIGTLNSSIVHPREIFKEAVSCSCAALICVHNHPSGNVTPSIEDIEVTKKLYNVSMIMDIPLLDHVIIGDNDYYSLKSNGDF